MKTILKIAAVSLLWFFTLALCAFQTATIGILPDAGPVLPATCNVGQLYFKTTATIGLNQCTAVNTWAAIGSGAGVTSVSGTANQIASTGGATPVLSIASPFTFPGVASVVAGTNAAPGLSVGITECGLWETGASASAFFIVSCNSATDEVAVKLNNTTQFSVDTNTAAFTGALNIASNNFRIDANGLPIKSNGITLAAQGFPLVVGSTSQKAETTTPDANVLTVAPPAAVGSYCAHTVISVASATSGVISWTMSYTDSNGNAQTNIAQPLFQHGTAAPNTTFTTSAAGNYHGDSCFDINAAAASIIIKWVGGGTTSAKMSAWIERIN